MTAGLREPLALARALIECRSVTPHDGGAQAVLARALAALGFAVTHLPSGPSGQETPNLFARIGDRPPHVCFAGHTDVVPPGDAGWTTDAFTPDIRAGRLFGRGACDMKGAIAAFVGACAHHLADGPPAGSLSLLITGDEEGIALHGTRAVTDWLQITGQMPDFCLVGEPTNPAALGEMIKIGRRGSLNAAITVSGIQGHAAYPERADNPAHRLVALLHTLIGTALDGGTRHFAPSGLQVTSIDIGNPATNVTPARATARLNIRFNDTHSGASLESWLREAAHRHAPDVVIDIDTAAEPFVSEIGREALALRDAVREVTGREPLLDTAGGTSDARFLAPFCRVAEFGLVGATMHQVDENVPVDDLRTLAAIYATWLDAILRPAVAA